MQEVTKKSQYWLELDEINEIIAEAQIEAEEAQQTLTFININEDCLEGVNVSNLLQSVANIMLAKQVRVEEYQSYLIDYNLLKD
jgi:hypothetical protein